MTTPKDVLDRARSQLGVHEDPFGSNRTPYSQWYGLIGPWCAMFVSWCFHQEGLPLPATTSKGFAYTPSGAAWFQSRGRWSRTPKVGAVVFFDFPGDAYDRISHVGIVESVNGDGTVTCLEGNTNGAGSRTGGEVMRHVRRTGIVGYGLPRYEGAASGPDPLPPNAPLREGDRGPQVGAWQRKLNDAIGARLEADGVFGPATHAATVRFQRRRGLEADGVVGSKTREAMRKALQEKRPAPPVVAIPPAPKRLLKLGVRGNDVQRWEMQIVKLGWDIEPDGLFDDETERACREFQERMRLTVDGIVGPQTWKATFTPPD